MAGDELPMSHWFHGLGGMTEPLPFVSGPVELKTIIPNCSRELLDAFAGVMEQLAVAWDRANQIVREQSADTGALTLVTEEMAQSMRAITRTYLGEASLLYLDDP
jgi:hypothetical protein